MGDFIFLMFDKFEFDKFEFDKFEFDKFRPKLGWFSKDNTHH